MSKELSLKEFLQLEETVDNGTVARLAQFTCPFCEKVSSFKRTDKIVHCKSCGRRFRNHGKFLSSIKPKGWQVNAGR